MRHHVAGLAAISCSSWVSYVWNGYLGNDMLEGHGNQCCCWVDISSINCNATVLLVHLRRLRAEGFEVV